MSINVHIRLYNIWNHIEKLLGTTFGTICAVRSSYIKQLLKANKSLLLKAKQKKKSINPRFLNLNPSFPPSNLQISSSSSSTPPSKPCFDPQNPSFNLPPPQTLMRKPKSKSISDRKEKRVSEVQQIEFLESWINFGKPDSGSNPLSIKPLPSDAPVGRIDENTFSTYAGCRKFSQLPISDKTKDGLKKAKFSKMTEIQRASLPHSLCGRDILGAAKTGSGKTLAFIVPILEKLYRARWGSEDGVGSIIITPTRELAGQIFDVLKDVGKHHGFSAGLLIGGRKDLEMEKERVNELNILVCTPGRLLQHMDETPNFDCSQLQVLVLDEADRILDVGFKKELNAIISQLPKHRQTLLFSATQTKSVQDLARLSLKDPEYLSVHEESVTATPSRLQQTAMIVSLDQKFDMLWSFIKAHLNSKILVFLSTCKQVKFVFEAFKKLRPGIPLKCLHGRMKQERRMGIYSQFCEEQRSVLFSTDVAARGLDFNKAVDWVVQMDCPDDVASYIHRVGRTARYQSGGRSLLFLAPSEEEMLKKLQSAKIPVQVIKANTKRMQTVSGLLAALLVKYPDLQSLAQRAFITYMRSVFKQGDKEVFDVTKLPIEEFSASLGLPTTPKIRFLNQKTKGKTMQKDVTLQTENDIAPQQEHLISSPQKDHIKSDVTKLLRKNPGTVKDKEDEGDAVYDLLLEKENRIDGGNQAEKEADFLGTRILKNKRIKINLNKPTGTRCVFNDEGKKLAPLEALSDTKGGNSLFQPDKVKKRYEELEKEMKHHDKEDKRLLQQRLREKRTKAKMKAKRGREEEEEDEDSEDMSGSDREKIGDKGNKKPKIYFDSDNEDGEKEKAGFKGDSISLAEQEALALKLLSSMHS